MLMRVERKLIQNEPSGETTKAYQNQLFSLTWIEAAKLWVTLSLSTPSGPWQDSQTSCRGQHGFSPK